MILTKREAEVLERLRVRVPVMGIVTDLGLGRSTVQRTVKRLEQKSAVIRPGRGNSDYQVLIDVYDIDTNAPEPPVRTRKPLERPPEPKPIEKPLAMKIHIPEGYEEYIRGHYGIIPRRELARRLNLDKVTLNLMILQIGLGGK